ncbi:hypothetical protein Q1695_016072 [Nippostrongylus brasiliensis]|nr:hypothetical protein Q1695_016072 [Nippostrongylus brasiliensis]
MAVELTRSHPIRAEQQLECRSTTSADILSADTTDGGAHPRIIPKKTSWAARLPRDGSDTAAQFTSTTPSGDTPSARGNPIRLLVIETSCLVLSATATTITTTTTSSSSPTNPPTDSDNKPQLLLLEPLPPVRGY